MRPTLVALLVLAGLLQCSRRSFTVLGFEPSGDGKVRLNEALGVVFSEPVDPLSCDAGALRLRRLGDDRPAQGSWHAEGNRLYFRPRVPERADLSDAGLLPGSRYRLEIPGLPRLRVVHARAGAPLACGFAREFETVAADSPEDLFRDPSPHDRPALVEGEGGERRRGGVLSGGYVLLRFSEPLHPVALAGAEFRLAGPWSRSLRPEQDPLVPSFCLLENQDCAVLQLALPAELPAPLDPRQEYGLILDRTHLQDLGNHPVFTDQPNAYVPITVAPPGSTGGG